MKRPLRIDSTLTAAFLAVAFMASGAPTTGDTPADFPYEVQFQVGDAQFAPGDNITITALRGTRDIITTNETYCVEGTYTLASTNEASLGFFATSANTNSTPVKARQMMDITKGTGTFRLIKTMGREGYLHVSFYNGNSFGGVYFGQGIWVLTNHNYSALNQVSRRANAEAVNAGVSGDPNAAIMEYLGKPVAPPADMDRAYSKKGLTKAVKLAAQNAGITLKKVSIEDSEFPFLVGIACQDGDWPKLRVELKKLSEYEYNGGTGSDTCNVFNLVPQRAFPPGSFQTIWRRLMLREMAFYEKFHANQ
jgi:hypothetical protein